ncbi:hypothetical protein LNAOJCKE_0412 [Methylorubrum aminovorans]|uniref:Terminase small subunit n=1 Tax=Methylorubrum aminovorans TaxID=269069 RepID=A0ABQ4U9U7_9HYPH|nr:hypothetical protein [Methylorubrum aminovorans]GJE63218.1 hypothetical protein LNAOJCKE_0412 [Methylorubrum aminovorans]GMA79261.1 hypothetical protein GCM10025880_56780 [Methylorubrum aminovorans]
MKKVGDGKYLVFEEGALSYVPPPKRVGPFNHRPRKRRPGFREVENKGAQSDRHELERPGWKKWRGRIQADNHANLPRSRSGRAKGQTDGTTREQMTLKNEYLAALFGEQDGELEEAASHINSEPNPLKRIAMRRYLKMIVMGASDRDVQKALDKILEFNAARPVEKQKIEVKTVAEDVEGAWDEDLGLGDFIPGKDACPPKTN